MIKLSSVAIALLTSVGLVGVAAAGDPKTDKAAPKADPKMADPKGAPKMDPKMMEMKAPAELADLAKSMTGTWSCKGQGMGNDMKMADMTATMKMSLEMNGWWVHDTFEAKMGKEPFRFESYTTYDAAAKKWNRVMVESGGGYSTGTSSGMTAGKMDWELSSHGPMGDGMFKDHVDASNPKEVKTWGEFSMDKGKTWMKVYEATCKK